MKVEGTLPTFGYAVRTTQNPSVGGWLWILSGFEILMFNGDDFIVITSFLPLSLREYYSF